MRLLVTNTNSKQAYSITRSLRPHAERIVATTSCRRPLGFSPADHAAYSRLVDARYGVPDPELDWLAGRVQTTNTALEEAFIERILEICARERIDTIFPSSDAWVYIFSKNKALLERHGILVPVPDLDTMMTPLDKYQTICAAQEVGFPCPATFLAESDEDVRRIARELAPPWVIKLRFTTGGRGMAFVEDRDKLVEKCRVTRARHGAPMIQEYIPGPDLTENVFVVLGRDGRPVVATTVRVRRQNFAISGPATASQMAPLGAIGRKAIVLAQHINWWGGVTVQYKLDARDGQPKLMEINPRLGIQLWYRTEIGINEPLMCLQIARGESVEAVKDNPTGCLLLRPFEDLILRPLDFFILALHRFQSAVVKHRLMDPLARLSPTENRFSCYWNDYFGKRERRLEPYVRYALADPLPLILWILKLLTSFLEGLTRKIGRRIRSFT